MIVLTLVFAGTFALLFGAYWLVAVVYEGRKRNAVRARLQQVATAPAAGGVDDLVKTPVTEPRSAVEHVLPTAERVSAYMQKLVDRSGLQVRVEHVLYAALGLFAVACSVGVVATGQPAIGVAAGAVALALPPLYLRRLARKRVRQFEEHFPEAVDIIARALRAGHAFTTGIVMVAEEVPEPVSTEFRLLYEHQNYGLPLSDALRDFAERVPLLDARLFVTAVLVQREVGGNLSEVLDNLGTVMRARAAVRRQVGALTAHGRLTGWILGMMPVALGGLLCFLNPEHARLLLTDPLGVRMITGAIVLQVTGMLFVRKIIAVEY